MKAQMSSSSNRLIVAMLVVAALAAAFWVLLLGPKREEAGELGARVESLQLSLAQHQAEAVEAERARREFPAEYQRLVVLGKAVPGDDDVASLLVQLNRVAEDAEGSFRDIKLTSAGGEESSGSGQIGTGAPPSEVAESLLPLGASIGPDGLGVMPYTLTFDGNFFQIANFIAGIDSLVKTNGEKVTVDGRLITVDSFTLEADQARGFPHLQANFTLTTYLTPPSASSGAEAPSAPEASTATPAAASVGGAP